MSLWEKYHSTMKLMYIWKVKTLVKITTFLTFNNSNWTHTKRFGIRYNVVVEAIMSWQCQNVFVFQKYIYIRNDYFLSVQRTILSLKIGKQRKIKKFGRYYHQFQILLKQIEHVSFLFSLIIFSICKWLYDNQFHLIL